MPHAFLLFSCHIIPPRRDKAASKLKKSKGGTRIRRSMTNGAEICKVKSMKLCLKPLIVRDVKLAGKNLISLYSLSIKLIVIVNFRRRDSWCNSYMEPRPIARCVIDIMLGSISCDHNLKPVDKLPIRLSHTLSCMILCLMCFAMRFADVMVSLVTLPFVLAAL